MIMLLAETTKEVNKYEIAYQVANYTNAIPMQDYEIAFILDESVNNIRTAKRLAFEKIEGAFI